MRGRETSLPLILKPKGLKELYRSFAQDAPFTGK